MENTGVEKFSEQFAELRELRDSQVLERQDTAEVYRRREVLLETFLESPEEVLEFYQSAYIRYKESIAAGQAVSTDLRVQAAETLGEANDFFREFGSFVLAYARGQQSEATPLRMHIVTEYPEEASQDVLEPPEPDVVSPISQEEDATSLEDTYRPLGVRNTVTGELVQLPNELTEAVMAVLFEQHTPLHSHDINLLIDEWSADGYINAEDAEVTEELEWIYKTFPEVKDIGEGRWKKYVMSEKDKLEWESPEELQKPATDTVVIEDETTATELVETKITKHEIVEALNPLEISILSYAKSGEPFRMEDLTKEETGIPEIQNMTKGEYDVFKQSFKQMRERIVSYLESRGIEATWELSGKARGRKYVLRVEAVNKENDVSIPAPSEVSPVGTEESQEPSPPKPTRKTGKAEQKTPGKEVSDHIVTVVRELEEEGDANGPGIKWTSIVNSISVRFGISKREADKLVRWAEKSSVLHRIGHHKGTRKLSIQAPPEIPAAKQQKDQAPDPAKEKKKDAFPLKKKHIKAASLIFDHLATKHLEQGVPVKSLLSDEGITKILRTKENTNRFIRRLQAEDIIKLVVKRTRKTALSKATKIPHVRFVDQETKDVWKNNKTEILKLLEELID